MFSCNDDDGSGGSTRLRTGFMGDGGHSCDSGGSGRVCPSSLSYLRPQSNSDTHVSDKSRDDWISQSVEESLCLCFLYVLDVAYMYIAQ